MICIGNFIQLTNQEASAALDRRHGEFSLMVDAPTIEVALTRFEERIRALRITSDFFEGSCKVYLVQVLEYDRIPHDDATMVNYRSFAGDPLMPFIDCVMPDEECNSCRIVEWEKSRPEVEDGEPLLFIEFGGGETE